jgi:hypothetical protein
MSAAPQAAKQQARLQAEVAALQQDNTALRSEALILAEQRRQASAGEVQGLADYFFWAMPGKLDAASAFRDCGLGCVPVVIQIVQNMQRLAIQRDRQAAPCRAGWLLCSIAEQSAVGRQCWPEAAMGTTSRT